MISNKNTVFIRQIFLTKPLIALAVLMCMATIITLFRLNRKKSQSRSDQFLIAFLGLLTIYEALKLLKNSGVVNLAMNETFQDAIELMVATSCLIACILLRLSRFNHLDVESAIRLARAAPPRTAQLDVPAGKDASSMEMLGWAVPRLSDGAFKLLAVLCLRSEAAGGRVPVGVADVQLRLGKSKEELDHFLKELVEAGAISVRRQGASMDIDIVTPAQRPVAAATGALGQPGALVTESRL